MSDLREKMKIDAGRIAEINQYLLDPNNALVNQLLEVVEKHGGVEAIKQKALEARKLENLMGRLQEAKSSYVDDLKWLMEKRDSGAFVKLADWQKKALAGSATQVDQANAVTLEISALNFFPWLMTEAKQAIANQELMPGRFIRVRNMAEQSKDNDLLAVTAAMQIFGSSWVETLDTKGTDGSNIHLGGPDTISGYFGGIGEPNHYAIKWIDEYLYYHTTYGVKQVLNINPGTVLLSYLLYKMGVDIEVKISVFMGNDNPYAILWTLMAARMFSREDGTTSLIGFNFSNSVDSDTILASNQVREAMGLTKCVRFEHHITEPIKHIVRQPYDRCDQLVEVAAKVPNISAKHEGGYPEIDGAREHPSDILEYFLPKEDIMAQGLMPKLELNYMDKHDAVNRTAQALTKAGIGVVAAPLLHG